MWWPLGLLLVSLAWLPSEARVDLAAAIARDVQALSRRLQEEALSAQADSDEVDGDNETDEVFLDPAASRCLPDCSGATCDQILERYPQYTCWHLEKYIQCDCTECYCNGAYHSTTSTTTTTTAWQPRQAFIAGVNSWLWVVTGRELGNNLHRAGRLRIRPSSQVCGDMGSSEMAAGVKPHCAGSVCLGPTENRIGSFGWQVGWRDVRIVVSGVYRLCWCAPKLQCAGYEAGSSGPGCCLTDADFSWDVGEVEVLGPKYHTFYPLLGTRFVALELKGDEVNKLHKVIIRPYENDGGNVPCGKAMSDEERSFSEISEWEIPLQYGGGSVRTFEGRVFKRRRFAVCWCPASISNRLQYDCKEETQFTAEIGDIMPVGPDTEEVPDVVTVVGAPFALTLRGDQLQVADRLRIVDAKFNCGDEDAKNSEVIARHVCLDGLDSCERSTIAENGPPNNVRSFHVGKGSERTTQFTETWEPVLMRAKGRYRLCWCVDETWDPVRMDSAGLCGQNRDFAVPVGMLNVEGVNSEQAFQCESFGSCRLRLESPFPISTGDRVLVVSPLSPTMRCGPGVVGLQANLSRATSMQVDSKTMYRGDFWLHPFAGPPGHFTICFCHRASMSHCNTPMTFGQRAGTLTIVSGGNWAPPENLLEPPICGALRPCIFILKGVWAMQLGDGDVFRGVRAAVNSKSGSAARALQAKETPCGEAATKGLGLFRLRSRYMLENGAWEAAFALDESSSSDGLYGDYYPAGDYMFCYCSAASLPSGHDCRSTKAEFKELSALHVKGAFPTEPKKAQNSAGASSWSCAQGALCNLTVQGWRLSRLDALRLVAVQERIRCGAEKLRYVDMPLGVEQGLPKDPAVNESRVSSPAEFALGRVYGTGFWRVCYCVASFSRGGRCEDALDFGQDIGLFTVEGGVTSVEPNYQHPATPHVLSVIVRTAWPIRMTCASAAKPMPHVPTTMDLIFCHDRIPQCLGVEQRPMRAEVGPNVFHVRINATHLKAGDLVHVWCTSEIEFCVTGSCAMPPVANGLEMELRPGVETWSDKQASKSWPFKLTIRGYPLNGVGGIASIIHGDGACGGHDARKLGVPSYIADDEINEWRALEIKDAGKYNVCWCDRSHVTGCAAWQRLGPLLIAGPTERPSVPQMLNTNESLVINITGIALSLLDQVAIVNSSSCGRKTKGAMPTSSAALSWSTGEVAQWQLKMPDSPGNFSMCWGPETGNLSTFLGHVDVRVYRDCVVSDWGRVLGESGNCSHECGGGHYEEERFIVEQPSGGGHECPASRNLSRRVPCNENPCPTMVATQASTRPLNVVVGKPFQVVLEGEALSPADDRILLVSGDTPCGDIADHSGGARCNQPGGGPTRVTCGDGMNSMRLDEPGLYRICVCDAWGGIRLRTNWVEQYSPCDNISSYSMVPLNGSLFRATGSLNEGNMAAPKKSNVEDNSLRTEHVHEHDTMDMYMIIVVIVVCVFNLGPITYFCCCRRARGCYRWYKRCRRKKDEEIQESPAKTCRGIDAKSLVAQATRDVWEAYSRTMVEAIYDVDLSAEENECENDEVAICDTASAHVQSRPTTGGSTTSEVSIDSSASDQTPKLSRPNSGLSRSLTPPLSRPHSGVSRPTSNRSRPMSRSTTTSSASHPSLLRVPLTPAAPTLSAPPVGGSFLDLTLTGKAAEIATPATPVSGSINAKMPQLDRSLSSWQETDDEDDGQRKKAVATECVETDQDNSSLPSQVNVTSDAEAEVPKPPTTQGVARTPPGSPAMRLPHVEPLHLPTSPKASPAKTSESPKKFKWKAAITVEDDESAADGLSPKDKSLLASSTARPPGAPYVTSPTSPCESVIQAVVAPPPPPSPPLPRNEKLASSKQPDVESKETTTSPRTKQRSIQAVSRSWWPFRWPGASTRKGPKREIPASNIEPLPPAFSTSVLQEADASESLSNDVDRDQLAADSLRLPPAPPPRPGVVAKAPPPLPQSPPPMPKTSPEGTLASEATNRFADHAAPSTSPRAAFVPPTIRQRAPPLPLQVSTSGTAKASPIASPRSPSASAQPLVESNGPMPTQSSQEAPALPSEDLQASPPQDSPSQRYEEPPLMLAAPASSAKEQGVPSEEPTPPPLLPQEVPPPMAPHPIAAEEQSPPPPMVPHPNEAKEQSPTPPMAPHPGEATEQAEAPAPPQTVSVLSQQAESITMEKQFEKHAAQQSLEENVSAFDGMWFEGSDLRGTIDGLVLNLPDGLSTDLQIMDASTLKLMIGEEELTGKLAPNGGKLVWSDGDVWTKGPTAKSKEPPKHQIADNKSEVSFEGKWFEGSDLRGTIRGKLLKLPDGFSAEVKYTGETTLTLTVDGEDVYARLEAHGQKLVWSDGDVWTREVPLRDKRDKKSKRDARPQKSADNAPITSFDGKWFEGARLCGTIKGSRLKLPAGGSAVVKPTSLSTLTALIDGEKLQAHLEAEGQELIWSNGDVWTREPAESQAHAPDEADVHRIEIHQERQVVKQQCAPLDKQQYALPKSPPSRTTRRPARRAPKALDDAIEPERLALESWQGADLGNAKDLLRPEVLAAQERLRAEWYERLAADGHLRQGVPKSPASTMQRQSTLRASAIPKSPGGSLPKSPGGSLLNSSTGGPQMAWATPTGVSGPGPMLPGPPMPGPPLPGARLPGPPLMGGSGTSSPMGMPVAGPKGRPSDNRGGPAWAFCAP